MLTASVLAFTGPVVAAPAMNPRMWTAAVTQANVELLVQRWRRVRRPGVGDTAEGEIGVGRMAEPDEIAAAVSAGWTPGGAWPGVRVLVTSGGTREPLDAVRYCRQPIQRAHGRRPSPTRLCARRRGDARPQWRCGRPAAPMRVIDVETAAELEAATLPAAAGADSW